MLPHGSLKPVLVQVVSIWREQLNPVITSVGNQDLVLAVASHVPRVVELTGLGTFLTKGQQEFATYCENLKRRKLSNTATV